MFASPSRGINAYAKVGLETGVAAASPHKLIIMLYEGARTAIQLALRHLREGDTHARGQAVTKAITIIQGGLRASLDVKAGGSIAESLDALYDYIIQRLVAAHARSRAEPLEEVARLLLELQGAWEQIGSNTNSTASVARNPFNELRT